MKSFDNFYKRRINRIYPTVLAWAIVSCLIFGRDWNIISILLYGGGWFVSCIMIYYVVLYFVRRYFVEHLKMVLVLSFLISIGLYFVYNDGYQYNMYGATYYKWIHYFIFMLQGAMMGLYSKRNAIEVKNGWMELGKTFVCVLLFYMFCSFKNSETWNIVQVLSLIPLYGVVHYVYRLLCLEVYLVQSSLFTDKLNSIFPINIPIIFIEIVLFAYIVRCLARIWAQTFKDNDYDWKEVIRVVHK